MMNHLYYADVNVKVSFDITRAFMEFIRANRDTI